MSLFSDDVWEKMMEAFWEYWYWYWFLAVVMYYASVLENSIGIKYLLSIPVRYEPPKGVGVVLSGLIYDRFVNQRDFISAILELKVAGLISISKEGEGDIKIEPVDTTKEISDLHMSVFYHKILFGKGNSSYSIPKRLLVTVRRFSKRERVPTPRAKEIIKDQFFLADKAAKWAVDEGYMSQNPRVARRRFFWISMFLIILALVIGKVTGLLPGFFLIIFVAFFYLPIYLFVVSKKSYGMKLFAVLLMSPLLIPLAPKFANPEFRDIMFSELHLGYYLLLAVVEIAFILLYERVGALTKRGKMVRNQLNGYKMFLKRVKLDEVNRRKETNPEYIDEVSPYMVLLGVDSYKLNIEQLTHYYHRG